MLITTEVFEFQLQAVNWVFSQDGALAKRSTVERLGEVIGKVTRMQFKHRLNAIDRKERFIELYMEAMDCITQFSSFAILLVEISLVPIDTDEGA